MASILKKAVAFGMTLVQSSDPNGADLEAAGVPVSHADCRGCADPCDEGHEEYPKLMIDNLSNMRGTVKPYHRQVVISTGKADWVKEVTDESGSLAKYVSAADKEDSAALRKAMAALSVHDSDRGANGDATGKPTPSVAGAFRSADSMRLSILNGSHTDFHHGETSGHAVIVLPDYKVISPVGASADDAKLLWSKALDPSVGRAGAQPPDGADKRLKSWVLPYNCVILLCSHKRRDNRCHIVAPKLQSSLAHALELEGWSVDTNLEDLSTHHTPIEDIQGSDEERNEEVLRQLKEISSNDQKRALILKNSHIGGHKFAGNVIIYKPQGSAVWYGRVTPHEVTSIVKNTILEGTVLPPLLRGGLNITKPNCKSLNDW